MTYDDKVRHDLTTILGAGETTSNDIDRAIPPLTLKAEDGRFVKVEALSAHTVGPFENSWVYSVVEDPAQ